MAISVDDQRWLEPPCICTVGYLSDDVSFWEAEERLEFYSSNSSILLEATWVQIYEGGTRSRLLFFSGKLHVFLEVDKGGGSG